MRDKRVFSDTQADLSALSVYLGPFYVPTPIKTIAGVFDAQQKSDLINKVTDAMVAVEGEAMRPLTWVIVEEVLPGDWGIGGAGVGVEAIRAIQTGAVSVRDALGV